MKKIVLMLPWPMSQGSYYAYNRRVKYVTKKGKAYQSLVLAEVFEQCAMSLAVPAPIDFTAIFYPPTKRVWDFDNHLKALQDSLTKAGVWTDDSAISEMHCYEGVVVPNGKVVVRIREGNIKLPYFSLSTDVFGALDD